MADLHTGDKAPVGLQREHFGVHTVIKEEITVGHAVDHTVISQNGYAGYGLRQLGIEGIGWPIDDWTGVPRADVQHQDDAVIGDGQVLLTLTQGHAIDGFPGLWRGDAQDILPGIQGEHQDNAGNEASEKEVGLLGDLQTLDLVGGVQGILLLTCRDREKIASRMDHRNARSTVFPIFSILLLFIIFNLATASFPASTPAPETMQSFKSENRIISLS